MFPVTHNQQSPPQTKIFPPSTPPLSPHSHPHFGVGGGAVCWMCGGSGCVGCSLGGEGWGGGVEFWGERGGKL